MQLYSEKWVAERTGLDNYLHYKEIDITLQSQQKEKKIRSIIPFPKEQPFPYLSVLFLNLSSFPKLP